MKANWGPIMDRKTAERMLAELTLHSALNGGKWSEDEAERGVQIRRYMMTNKVVTEAFLGEEEKR